MKSIMSCKSISNALLRSGSKPVVLKWDGFFTMGLNRRLGSTVGHSDRGSGDEVSNLIPDVSRSGILGFVVILVNEPFLVHLKVVPQSSGYHRTNVGSFLGRVTNLENLMSRPIIPGVNESGATTSLSSTEQSIEIATLLPEGVERGILINSSVKLMSKTPLLSIWSFPVASVSLYHTSIFLSTIFVREFPGFP
jgi:hypothetical protein